MIDAIAPATRAIPPSRCRFEPVDSASVICPVPCYSSERKRAGHGLAMNKAGDLSGSGRSADIVRSSDAASSTIAGSKAADRSLQPARVRQDAEPDPGQPDRREGGGRAIDLLRSF